MTSAGTNKLAEIASELFRQKLLARVRLGAFSVMPSAVIVHVPSLLDFRYEQAAAMPATDQAAESEVVADAVPVGLTVVVQEGMNPFPGFLADQWLIVALICLAVEIEIATVEALS